MTDVSTMSDRELEHAIAEAMGWERCTSGGHDASYPSTDCYVRPGRASDDGSDLPVWAIDLNALRDGPERVLREAGWRLSVATQGDWAGAAWRFPVFPSPFAVPEQSEAPTEARARAEAVLQALQVMKGEGNG